LLSGCHIHLMVFYTLILAPGFCNDCVYGGTTVCLEAHFSGSTLIGCFFRWHTRSSIFGRILGTTYMHICVVEGMLYFWQKNLMLAC
jgi:hypothetical protein